MLAKLLGGLFLLALLVGGAAGWQAYAFLTVPPQTPGQETHVLIEPGESFDRIAASLHEAGVITNPLYFRLLARVTKQGQHLKAGEYELSTGLLPSRVLALLVSGQAILHKVSVPEGLTLRQIARLVDLAGLGSVESFERASRDKTLLEKYGVPADNAEGFLFPDTYLFTRKPGNDARQVVEAMLRQFARKLPEAWPTGPPKGKSLFEAVVLASIVEKETGRAEERARIAGVFVSRLDRGMLLQTDPTVIYGLGDRFDGNLKRSHLDDPANAYNTYQHAGLPPGPICNPGVESLRAVAKPERDGSLYFVSKGDGTHFFSRSLDEHNDAVSKYQLRKGRRP